MSRSVASAVFLSGFLVSSSFSPVQGQTEWLSPVDGLWSVPENWSAGAPTASTGVTAIENAGSKTVLVDEATPIINLEIQRLQIGSIFGTNTLLLRGPVIPLQADGSVIVNPGGRIRVENGEFILDGLAGSSLSIAGGQIELAGGDFNLINAARGRIGFGAGGAMRVSSGTLSAGEDLLVGALNLGDGLLEITGGEVEVAQGLILADDVGSAGRVEIISGRLTATNNLATTRIGDDGIGRFNVNGGIVELDDVSVGRAAGSIGHLAVNGGTVTTKDITLGRFAGAEGNLVVNGGTLLLPEDSLLIGREGKGSATITSGTVVASNVEIGTNSTSTGSLVVNGGVLAVSSNIVVGSSARAGSLTLSSGTIVATNQAGTASVIVASGNVTLSGGVLRTDQLVATNQAGTLTLSAGTIRTGGTRIENGSRFVVGDGTQAAVLHLEGGTHVFAGGLEISANATMSGCGTIVGTIINNGTISTNCLGESPTLTNPRIAGGSINFDFATAIGPTYVVEYKNSLSDATWTVLRSYAGTGGTITVSDSAVGTARFYRVRLE